MAGGKFDYRQCNPLSATATLKGGKTPATSRATSESKGKRKAGNSPKQGKGAGGY